ncbi:mechanosensitive ion channel-like protein [Thermovibrio guaymasensis]|uniref:Mechanosensitive ion channel-like protein n=1 Tax=Thermovibrio guaymasensis TaxID=240167 RepID=A0A420W988_9BACT|nr:mechanosensitive ion channel family protein [Thermovibrio guaymasensis]RKQ63832.1 mechanosensitive ion channel-like protein [Thermovibrio guaymasensis]
MAGKDLWTGLLSNFQNFTSKHVPWLKVEYVFALSFLFLSLLSLWSRKFFRKLLMKFFLRDKRLTKAEKMLVSLSNWISYFFSLLFINLAFVQLSLPTKVLKVFNTAFFILYVFILTFVFARLVEISLERISQRVRKKVSPTEAPLVDTYYSMISKIVNVFIVLIALIAILDKLGFNVTSLVTSLGVGSLAVGLAAQDTIKNFISGILLVTDRQFRIGDRVYIKNIDVEGYVYDIGLRTTRILTISGNNLITVPNSKLTEGVIENSLYPDPKVKDSVEVGVAYGTDVEKVKELLIRSVEGVAGVLKEPPPSVYFTQFGDSSLIFKLIYYVERKDLAFGVKSTVNERIKRLFEENGIEIPFPQQDVWFRNPLRVEGERGKTL